MSANDETPEQRAERARVGHAIAAAVNSQRPQHPFQVVLAALDISVSFAEANGWKARDLIAALLVSECNDNHAEAIAEIEKIAARRRAGAS
jgi:hypothetical protein